MLSERGPQGPVWVLATSGRSGASDANRGAGARLIMGRSYVYTLQGYGASRIQVPKYRGIGSHVHVARLEDLKLGRSSSEVSARYQALSSRPDESGPPPEGW